MDISQFSQNRTNFPEELLLPHQGRWVAFSSDGLSILASGETLEELETRLAILGENPQEVFLERILGAEDDIILGAEDLR